MHRDLKPQNIMVTPSNQIDQHNIPKLIDFGFTTETNLINKTPSTYPIQYRSPQIFVGDNYNQKSDIWAFGCIAAQFALKYPLFNGNNQIGVLNKIVKLRGPLSFKQNNLLLSSKKMVIPKFKKVNLREKLKNISNEAFKLIQKCLNVDPQQRISSSEALAQNYFDAIFCFEQCKRLKVNKFTANPKPKNIKSLPKYYIPTSKSKPKIQRNKSQISESMFKIRQLKKGGDFRGSWVGKKSDRLKNVISKN